MAEGDWTNPIEFPPVEREVRWTRRRRAAALLGVVAFLALLVGSILTYRQGLEANESGDLDVCLAGAEAAAIVDFARQAVPEDELSSSFLTLEEVSADLPWRSACDRVLEDDDGLSPSEIIENAESYRETIARLDELRRLASRP